MYMIRPILAHRHSCEKKQLAEISTSRTLARTLRQREQSRSILFSKVNMKWHERLKHIGKHWEQGLTIGDWVDHSIEETE